VDTKLGTPFLERPPRSDVNAGDARETYSRDVTDSGGRGRVAPGGRSPRLPRPYPLSHPSVALAPSLIRWDSGCRGVGGSRPRGAGVLVRWQGLSNPAAARTCGVFDKRLRLIERGDVCYSQDMEIQWAAFATGLNWLIASVCFAQTAPQVTAADVYEHAHSSVVVVIVGDRNSKPIGQGSGFIVAKNRIVTNHHVVEGAGSALVVFSDGSSEQVEGVASDSPARDLAILVVKTGRRLPLRLGDELSARQGDSVYALGAPRGLESSFTNGIVSGFRNVDDQFVLQTTAPIAPGSSGGPLLDGSGRVIGVTTAFLGDSPGIYFSIGARDVKRLLRTPNLVSMSFSAWSHNDRAEAESVATGGTVEKKDSSDAGAVVADKSQARPEGAARYGTKVWKNLRDGQTYRTSTDGTMLFLESVDDYVHRASDITSCELRPAVSIGLNWMGICWVRNPKDQSTYKSAATINVFSETRIEGSTEYIPKFVMIPDRESSVQEAGTVASGEGLFVTSDPPGADVFINGAKQSGQTPVTLPLAAGQYNLVLRLQGYNPYVGNVRVKNGVQTQLDAKLTLRLSNP
jgi:S1-C subfamily serine protease